MTKHTKRRYGGDTLHIKNFFTTIFSCQHIYFLVTVVVVLIFNKGPMHGLQLTVNVQLYENIPFLDKDSGIKASLPFM